MKKYFSTMREATASTSQPGSLEIGRKTWWGLHCTRAEGPVAPAKWQRIRECGASTLRSSDFSRESRNPVILCKVSQFLKRPQKSLKSYVDPILFSNGA